MPDQPAPDDFNFFRRFNHHLKDDDGKFPVYFGVGLIAIFLVVASLAPSIGKKLGLVSVKKQNQQSYAKQEPTPEGNSVHDEILVRFKPGADDKVKKGTLSRYNLTEKEEIPRIGVKVIKVNPKARDHVIEALSHNPAIDFAEENRIVKVAFSPNDPWFVEGFQWNMTKIQAPQAWDITKGSSSFPIAILDTGIDLSHPDLQGKVIDNVVFSMNPDGTIPGPSDVNGHGTAVGGIASAVTNNATGVAGLGFNTPLMNVKVMADNGTGGDSWVAQGVVWATDHGAKVINMSLGGQYPDEKTLTDAISYAWSKGVVVAAAAGNSNSSIPFYPAAEPNVIAVASTGSLDQLANSSDYGDWVDVAAPGGNVYSTVNLDNSLQPGGYGVFGGTSFASPHAAGLAALVFTKVTDVNGDGLLNDEVVSCIQNNTDPINASLSGGKTVANGRINAYKAVQCAPAGAPDTTAPTASITAPSSGSTVSGSITVTANATDNVGVTKVELYVDGSLFATDTSSPYSFYWDTTKTSNGSHTLIAKAYDSAGNVGTSSTVSVTVSNSTADTIAPTTSITSPANGSTVSGTTSITASASDNVGVSAVDFFIDGALLGEKTAFPYAISWDTTSYANGSHTIYSKAVDAAGNIGTSTTITVTVSNTTTTPTPVTSPSVLPSPSPVASPAPTPIPSPIPSDTVAPTVTITSPLGGSILTRNSTAIMSATVFDNAAVSKVEFYVSGSLKCTVTGLPYSCSWKVPGKPNAAYQITVKGYDPSGNVGTATAGVTAK